MTRTMLFLLLAACAAGFGQTPPPSPTADRQPQLAAHGHMTAMVFGRGHEILFQRSKDGGATFSKPVAIGTLPAFLLGRHRGPRIAFAGDTILVSAIGGATVASADLHLWRSADGGKTWSRPVIVNDVPASAREGLHAMAADASGNAAAVWLDLRSPGTRLYGSFSSDAGATWSRNSIVFESPGGTICQCCHPSLLALGRGQFAVMFRNVAGGDRDMYLLRVQNGQILSGAEKLGTGSWQLDGCPMDGGGLAQSGNGILTAWRRGEDIFLAAPGEPEEKIGSGKDVALAAGDGTVYAVWNQAGEIEARVASRIQLLSKAGAFPVVAALPDGAALAAWEEDGTIKTQRLVSSAGDGK